MARLPGAFNPNDHEEMADFSAMPPDWYPAEVSNSEKLESNKNAGNFYWKMEFKINQGKYAGRKIWTNLNLINKSPQAVEIAQRELTSICKACRKGPIEDTAELHGKYLMVKLGIEPATPKYPEKNTVTGYKPMEGISAPSNPVGDDEPEEEEQKEMPWEMDDDIQF